MKLSLSIIILSYLTILDLLFLIYFTFLLETYVFLLIYASSKFSFFTIPYIFRFYKPTEFGNFEKWLRLILEGLLFSTVIVSFGWFVFSFLFIFNPYRILFWRNFYSMLLISLSIVPISYNLYNFHIESMNFSKKNSSSIQKRNIKKNLFSIIAETIPFIIFGAIVINLVFYVLLFFCLILFIFVILNYLKL
jgi:hypothetical protein